LGIESGITPKNILNKNIMINAINKRHQSKVNRAAKWVLKYNKLNDLRNEADGNGDEKLLYQLGRKCAGAFDSYLEIIDELPLRERAQIDKLFYISNFNPLLNTL
jgi:hypothetical protein